MSAAETLEPVLPVEPQPDLVEQQHDADQSASQATTAAETLTDAAPTEASAPAPGTTEPRYSHTLADGREVHADSAEEAIKRCPFLGRMPLEQAQVLLDLASIGKAKRLADEAAKQAATAESKQASDKPVATPTEKPARAEAPAKTAQATKPEASAATAEPVRDLRQTQPTVAETPRAVRATIRATSRDESTAVRQLVEAQLRAAAADETVQETGAVSAGPTTAKPRSAPVAAVPIAAAAAARTGVESAAPSEPVEPESSLPTVDLLPAPTAPAAERGEPAPATPAVTAAAENPETPADAPEAETDIGADFAKALELVIELPLAGRENDIQQEPSVTPAITAVAERLAHLAPIETEAVSPILHNMVTAVQRLRTIQVEGSPSVEALTTATSELEALTEQLFSSLGLPHTQGDIKQFVRLLRNPEFRPTRHHGLAHLLDLEYSGMREVKRHFARIGSDLTDLERELEQLLGMAVVSLATRDRSRYALAA